MAEEEIDLNSISIKAVGKLKRPRPVESPPDDGDLLVTLYCIVLRVGVDTYTKSRQPKEITFSNVTKHVTKGNSGHPTIVAGSSHRIIVDLIGVLARTTIAEINSGSGLLSEASLVENGLFS